mmetsp:Transcript_7540/g.11052  ORF Transcript_7540/g.11052 Transcript_7540/m.11052 type:complete len:220 (-) Transcript_7540:198-857(-)
MSRFISEKVMTNSSKLSTLSSSSSSSCHLSQPRPALLISSNSISGCFNFGTGAAVVLDRKTVLTDEGVLLLPICKADVLDGVLGGIVASFLEEDLKGSGFGSAALFFVVRRLVPNGVLALAFGVANDTDLLFCGLMTADDDTPPTPPPLCLKKLLLFVVSRTSLRLEISPNARLFVVDGVVFINPTVFAVVEFSSNDDEFKRRRLAPMMLPPPTPPMAG